MSPSHLPLDCFLGRAEPHAARAYLRLPLPAEADWELRGRLTGPFREAGRTLPTVFPFRSLGEGPTLLAATEVVDPCYWSPDTPVFYQLEAELRRGSEICGRWKLDWALRRFGVRSGFFRLNEQRWQPRFVARSAFPAVGPGEFRAAFAHAWLERYEEPFLAEAIRRGVFVFGELHQTGTQLVEEARRWARFGCVGGLLVTQPPEDWSALREAAPNLLLGAAERIGRTIPACDFETFAAPYNRFQGQDPRGPLPQVALRRLRSSCHLAEARGECDALQRDLAHLGDFAGYGILALETPAAASHVPAP